MIVSKKIKLRFIFKGNQDIERFSKFGPSDYESQFVSRSLHRVESEIIESESSGFESQNFESSLEPPSSESSDSDDSTDNFVYFMEPSSSDSSDSDSADSADDFASFVERPISPPMNTFGASDSFVEDPYYDNSRPRYGIGKITPRRTYFTNDDWAAIKFRREGTCDKK